MTLKLANTNDNNAFNTQQLAQLNTRSANHEAITTFAQNCFADIEALRPGVGHNAKKVLCGAAGVVVIPTAICAGGYYAISSLTRESIIGGITTAGVTTTLTTALAIKSSGVRNFVYLIAAATTAYAIDKTYRAATKWATDIEERFKDIEREQHDLIKRDLQETYDGVAKHLMTELKNAKKTSNQKVYELQLLAHDIETALPKVKSSTASVGLTAPEATVVLKRLADAVQSIREADIALKNTATAKENLSWLTDCPVRAMDRVAIPYVARAKLDRANKNTLGLGFTAKKYGATAGSSAVSLVAVPAIYAAMTCASDTVCSNPITAAAGAVGLAAIAGGVYCPQRVFRSYSEYQDEKARIVTRSRAEAIEILKDTYNCMARLPEIKGKDVAEQLQMKTAGIRAEMARVGLTVAEQDAILKELKG